MASQIPGYQIIRKVGDGGMSSVYLAIQYSVGREVALKVLSPELRDDPSFAERFYREANIVGMLSHPNVISIYDIGKHQQHYFMAMDYLPGASCSDLVKSRQLTPARALNVLKDVAAALAYVHQKGYLHCDIKPDNILFRANGSAVLTDFGIARENHDISSSATISGTPHYMSPEQAQGKKIDVSSDIYSMGVLLYELLTFKLPYTGEDAIAVAIKHVSAPIPALPLELKQLQPLINKMMHKKSGSRFRSADELIEAIDYIGAEFLGQDMAELSWRLKLDFLMSLAKERSFKLVSVASHLQFSAKHGLLYRNNAEGLELPDLDLIERSVKANTMASTVAETLNTTSLKNDVVALAIESEHVHVIFSAKQIFLSMAVVALGFTSILFGADALTLVESYTRPSIKFVD